jgi:Transcription factor WhiB
MVVMTWRLLAACRGLTPDMFYDPATFGDALRVCAGCPVWSQCRQYAEDNPPLFESVWGGRVYPQRYKGSRCRKTA